MKQIVKLMTIMAFLLVLSGCAKNPVITVPDGVLEFTIGDKDFTDATKETRLLVGVTASPSETDLKITNFGGFDINTIGEYTITIEALASNGKTSTATRTVKVVDREKPTLNVPTAALELYEKDETFTESKLLQGVSATDDVDETLSPAVSDLGGFDINVVGVYTITITVTNTGNKTATATRTVKVLERSLPLITEPSEEVILETGETLTELEVIEALEAKGFAVTDEFDNAPEITITNYDAIDFNLEGLLTLNITVTDKYGKTATAEIDVTVYANKKPEVLETGMLVMDKTSNFNVAAFLEAFKQGIVTKDDMGTIGTDDDAAVEISNEDITQPANFVPNVTGTYIFQVIARDAQGASVTFEKKVKVVEPGTRVIVVGTTTYDVSGESNYAFNGTADPANYEVAIYTFRGEQDMVVPASGYAWLLKENYELKQILSGDNFLSSLTMAEDDLLVVFGKETSQTWANQAAELNAVVSLHNIEITELLDAPEATKDVNVLSWAAIEGATGYDIYMNGEIYQRVTVTTFDLTTVFGISQAENIFTVRAVSSRNRSLASADVMHTYSTVAGAVDSTTMWFELGGNRNDDQGDVLVWGSVAGAVQYRVLVDGKLIAIVNTVEGLDKYQYDIKTGNLDWRVIPEIINYVDNQGLSYPLLDNLGQPMYDKNGEPLLKPISTQTYNSYTFNFTVVALVANAVMTPSDPIAFVVTRLQQPKLFASKFETGRDDVYDGIAEYNLASHPVFIPGGTFASYDQHLIDNDSFIFFSRAGMDNMTAMSYVVNGNLEIMRLTPQDITNYVNASALTPIPGVPGILEEPAYATPLSMLTMPKTALTALNMMMLGQLTPNPDTVYYESTDFFGVKFNPLFLADAAVGQGATSTNDKFIVADSATGQSGVCVWSQLLLRGDKARWYDSIPSTRMLLAVPGKADAVGSTIMNYAPGTIEIISETN